MPIEVSVGVGGGWVPRDAGSPQEQREELVLLGAVWLARPLTAS